MTNRYSTHLPMLAACVAHTSGPVLELGCGEFSTPVLSALCLARHLLSVESDPAWLAQFDYLRRAGHRIELVESWDDAPIDVQWDVVLIDHAPAARRVVDIMRLKDLARLIVLHDTEHRLYEYDLIWPAFKYRAEWKRRAPWTSVVSNFESLEWLEPIL